MNRFLAAVAFGLALSGCASVPMGDAGQDAALKTFKIAPNRAGIYVYRNESMGGAVKMNVTIDGIDVGQTAAKTYLFVEVAPGLPHHRLEGGERRHDRRRREARNARLRLAGSEDGRAVRPDEASSRRRGARPAGRPGDEAGGIEERRAGGGGAGRLVDRPPRTRHLPRLPRRGRHRPPGRRLPCRRVRAFA
jgi:hypothetical protein